MKVARGPAVAAVKALLFAGLAYGLTGLAPLCGQDAEQNVAGLPVGRNAPAFELPDQQGRKQTLGDLLKQGPVALVFYRSADW